MPVYQALMADGDWSLRLKPETPLYIREAMAAPFAHVVVTSAPVDPTAFSDADILANSRYVGVCLRPGPALEVSGRGLSWWLGDDNGTGSSIAFIPIALNTNIPNTAASTILNGGSNAPLTLSASSPGSGAAGATINQEYNWYTKRQLLDSVIREFFNREWKTNNDFTVSVGTADQLYTTTPAIITPKTTGYESGRYGISGQTKANIDYEDFANIVWLLSKEGVTTWDYLPAWATYYDGRGNPVRRQRFVDTPEAAFGNRVIYAQNLVTQYAQPRFDYNLQTSRYDISGKVQMGGNVYVYDPVNGFYATNIVTGGLDTSNPIRWRGDIIYPKSVRVVGMRWPIEEGMGVLWRNRNASGVSYIDLTPYVEMESGSATLEVGGTERPIEAPNYAGSNSIQQFKFNQWETYTPVLTACTIGNGSISGRYRRDGVTLHISIHMNVGSTTTFSGGAIGISLPPTDTTLVSYMTAADLGGQQSVNMWWYDANTTLLYDGVGIIYGTQSTFTPWASIGGANLTALGAGILAVGDDLHLQGTIEAQSR